MIARGNIHGNPTENPQGLHKKPRGTLSKKYREPGDDTQVIHRKPMGNPQDINRILTKMGNLQEIHGPHSRLMGDL